VPGLADSGALMKDAFSAKVNGNPQSVSSGEGMAVFQVVDVHGAHAPSFDEYKSHIADDYAMQQVPQLLDKKARELADKAHAYNDLKKAAKELGATVKTSDLVGQQAQVPDIGPLTGPAAQVFTLNPGQISGQVNTGRAAVVMQVLEKKAPTDAEIASAMDQTREAMVGQRREDVFSVYVNNLEQQYTKDKLISYNKKAQAAATQPVIPQS
jgi:peptidyl-prolyl cis-trans isomerase D